MQKLSHSSQKGFVPIVSLLVIILLLVGIAAVTVGFRYIHGLAASASEMEKIEKSVTKAGIRGVLLQTTKLKCQKTEGTLCYKLFLEDGISTIFVKFPPTATEANINAVVNRRVIVKGKPATYNGTDYIAATKIPELAPFDPRFSAGLGGGYTYVGNPSIEGNGNGYWHNDLGVKSLSEALYWSEAEPTKDAPFVESAFPDGAVDNCTAKGYRCSLLIDPYGWPSWMGSPKSAASDEAKLTELKEFARELSRRYGTRVDLYEFLNELDLGSSISPKEYARLQQYFYDGIKLGNTQAKVSFARLGSATPNTWITQLLAEEPNMPVSADNDGKKRFFDVMNLHHYAGNNANWKDFDSYSKGGVRGLVTWINQEMKRAKPTEEPRPIIFTEFGQPVAVTPAAQAEQAKIAFKMLPQAFSMANVELIQWYILQNDCNRTSTTNPTMLCYGLILTPESGQVSAVTKTPSYFALKTISKELNGMQFLKLDTENTNLEGYVFVDAASFSPKRKEVVWKRPGSPGANLTKVFKAPSVRVVRIEAVAGSAGAIAIKESVIRDGQAGDKDNRAEFIGVELPTDMPAIVDLSQEEVQ